MSYVGHSLGDVIFLRSMIPGTDLGSTAKQTGAPWISMKDKRTIAFVLDNGAVAVGAAGTIIFAVEQATDNAGAGAKAITGATLTVTASTAFRSAGDALCVEVDVGNLDTENDFFFVAPVWTFSDVTGTNDIQVMAMAVPNRMQREVNSIAIGVGVSTNYVKAG